jgi:hypothetical protein
MWRYCRFCTAITGARPAIDPRSRILIARYLPLHRTQGNQRVVAIDLASGTHDTLWVSTQTDFEYPIGCALSADGATLFVTDGDDKRVVALCAATGAHQDAYGHCGSGTVCGQTAFLLAFQ